MKLSLVSGIIAMFFSISCGKKLISDNAKTKSSSDGNKISLPVESIRWSDVLCQFNSHTVMFKSVGERPTSRFIWHREADLRDGAKLLWDYNPFYQIGGSVTLIDQSGPQVRLLVWDNGFEEDVLSASVRVNNEDLECEAVPMR